MAEVARISKVPEGSAAALVAHKLRAAIGVALEGKPDVVERAIIAVLARGHLLLEDLPGVGKTTLARALAGALGLRFARVQCTSDLLPSDVLGINVYDALERRFEFRPGPVFTNVLLADEINRASPKTQSALLEAMSERQVTIDGVTRRLEEPFLVIATQNPDDASGTFPLPDNQLDRFLLRTRIGYPSPEVERQLLLARKEDSAEDVEAAVTVDELLRAQDEVERVVIRPAVLDYAQALITASREPGTLAIGVSTRGAKAFVRAACARALVQGRNYLLPDDVSEVALPVLAHRVRVVGYGSGVSAYAADDGRNDAEVAIRDIVRRTAVPL